MYITVLGRQGTLGLAEVEGRYGAEHVKPIGDYAALITDIEPNLEDLGGSIKLGRVLGQGSGTKYLGLSKKAVALFERELSRTTGKITVGVSAYEFDVTSREVQKTGLILKSKLQASGHSVRLIPNDSPALSSASTMHNKLGTSPNKRELLLIAGETTSYICETLQVQDIDAYTFRDRSRPRRDPLNGMLPPKLAQMLINMSINHSALNDRGTLKILDPFCGTGVVLQEAMLMGYNVIGTDINPKMVRNSEDNLAWAREKLSISDSSHSVYALDATTGSWDSASSIDQVATETYLGNPMSTEPVKSKLDENIQRCNEVVRGFLKNLSSQILSGTTLAVAIPAWRVYGDTLHLSVVDEVTSLGYNRIDFKHVSSSQLLYYREDQIVAREILVLSRS